MTADERRAMIVTAALPLFIKDGTSVTTRQLADHLGIAEGTIFRAFGDKDALVRAVVDTFFEQTFDTLAADLLDSDLSFEQKLHALITQARARAKGTFTMLSLLEPGSAHDYIHRAQHAGFGRLAAAAFEADAALLNMSQEKLTVILHMLVIAAAAPHLCDGEHLSDADLVEFAMYGMIGQPEPAAPTHDGRKA